MRRLGVLACAALVLAGCGGSAAPKGPPDLLFVSTKDGDYAVFGADARGNDVRRLTAEKGAAASPAGLFFQGNPAWSPDGTRIAFDSRRDRVFHIFVMDVNGTGTMRLTNTKREDDRPAWSPDGSNIAFSREGALFEIPVAGGAARRVVPGLGNADNPAFSPDGKWVAYDYRKPGFSIREIYVVHADGSGARQVTDLRAVSARPAWSPDGKRLAFQSDVYGGHLEVYTVGVDGKGVTRVTTSDTDAIQPDWSSDGMLAFSRDGAIWVDTGGKQKKLTSGKNNDSAPAWRPMPPQ